MIVNNMTSSLLFAISIYHNSLMKFSILLVFFFEEYFTSLFVRLLTYMQKFLSTTRAVQGALLVASSIQIILEFRQIRAICSF